MLTKRSSKILLACLVCFAVLVANVFILFGNGFAWNKANSETIEYGVDLAYGRRVVSTDAEASSVSNVYAVDAKSDTRYASKQQDDAFFYIDLGNTEKINKIVIDWEAAYAKEYKVQLSMDAITWTDVAMVTKDSQSKDVIEFPYYLQAKFVKFQGIKRATNYGYSFYSFEVYGPKSLTADTVRC